MPEKFEAILIVNYKGETHQVGIQICEAAFEQPTYKEYAINNAFEILNQQMISHLEEKKVI